MQNKDSLFDQINDEDKDETRIDPRLKPVKTIRIAISGDVHVTAVEKLIIDTPAFQRLRRVRQLGTVNMVYPTALHTRFDHCLGTMAMASRMVRAIEDNAHSSLLERRVESEQKILVRLYALLHDIPHIPFGHTLEDELEIFVRHDKNPARLENFLGVESEIGKIIIEKLGRPIYDRFWSIYNWHGDEVKEETKITMNRSSTVKGKDDSTKRTVEYSPTELINPDDAFVYDIVSNTVCADLLDYIARDSYFCNLGTPMEYRFLNFLYLAEVSSNIDKTKKYKRVVIRLWKGDHPQPRRDTLTDLARLMEARYMIAERAYFHHAKIISGAMLGRALLDEFRPLTGGPPLPEDQMYEHSDDSLLYSLLSSESDVSRSLARKLLDRELYKNRNEEFDFKYTRSDFDSVQAHDHRENAVEALFSKLKDPVQRRTLENDLADEVGAEPGDVIIYAPEEKMNLKVAKMKVLWKGKLISFDRIDDPIIKPRLAQILKAHELLWSVYVMFNRKSLDDEQVSILKETCDIEFLCLGSRTNRLQKLRERQVERYLNSKGYEIPNSAPEYLDFRREAAKSLTAAARTRKDDLSFQARLKNTCEEYFTLPPKNENKDKLNAN